MKKRNPYQLSWNALMVVLIVFLVTACQHDATPAQEEITDLPDQVDFNFHIRPILSNNCFVCHGPDESSREAGLRLDTYEGATARLESGQRAIVPNNLRRSELVKRISSTDPEVQMPTPESKKSLTAREIALLKKWIDQGAEYQKHWAYIAPEAPELSENLAKAPTSKIIDHLLQKKIAAKDLHVAAKANKNSLIRRVAYLMTGLPPTPEEVKTFLADKTNDAYAKMVDSYLASPHFGERWARHWMDLVRYGESMGHEGDFNISSPHEYRDYLIRAFNLDVPYDQFVKEHIAGDMLLEQRYHPQTGYNESALGTAYYFLGEGKHSPVNIKLEEADKIDNMIDVTSKTFQGLTVACARCHDHKFDPIPTADYYAMYGMIESARLGPIPARRTKKQAQNIEKLKTLKQQIKEYLAADLLNNINGISSNLPVRQADEKPPQAKFTNFKEEPEEEKKENFKIEPKKSNQDSTAFEMMGDFRKGTFDGWYADGVAFGESPIKGEPIINNKTFTWSGVDGAYASSRQLGTGVQGALRSPNFIIEHDSIAVRARGLNSDIRIVVENFQVIQGPLYQDMHRKVDSTGWVTYTVDMSLCKGQKAYVELLSGTYQFGKHVFRIEPQDFMEVEWVLAFNHIIPEVTNTSTTSSTALSASAKSQLIKDWSTGNLEAKQIQDLKNWLTDMPAKALPKNVKTLLGDYNTLASELYDSTHVIGMAEGDAVFSSVFIKGSVDNQSKEKVSRRFLTAVENVQKEFPQKGSGRLIWAESVVDPSNPLTARVMVNRLWHHVFGRGIVETVDNYGLQGKLPSHPGLLDYLAIQFMEQGWSIKTMLKHLMMTEAFQRSTEAIASNQSIDPQNIYLHHFPIRRLESEAIRDGILAVSGELDRTMYGKPVPVHLNEHMTGRGRPRNSGPLDGAGRRSIYTSVRRNFINPMMLVFDMPIPFSTFGKRNTTNVPAQSLTLMNDPFVHDQAEKWANNLLKVKSTSIDQRIEKLYWLAFSRSPEMEEVENAKSFFTQQAKQQNKTLSQIKNDPKLWMDYCHTLINLKEFIHLL